MFSVFPPSKKQYLCKTKYNFVYPYWPVVSRFVNGVLGLPAGISLWSSKVIRQLLSPFISMLLRTSHNAVSIRFIHWLIFFITYWHYLSDFMLEVLPENFVSFFWKLDLVSQNFIFLSSAIKPFSNSSSSFTCFGLCKVFMLNYSIFLSLFPVLV